MRTNNRALVLAFIVLPLASAVSPGAAIAQANGGPPIFLAQPDVYPDVDGRVTLLREAGREIVVLSDAATPEDLGVAIRLLARFQREHGRPEQGSANLIPVVGLVTPRLNDARRSRLEEVLDELRTRPVTNVGNLGRGRWMPWDPR